MFKTLAISSSVSNEGCLILLHHSEIVAGFLPNLSASHLCFMFCSAKTTRILFNLFAFKFFVFYAKICIYL